MSGWSKGIHSLLSCALLLTVAPWLLDSHNLPAAHLLLRCCCRYPKDAWEMMLGYDQDRFMGARAGAALVAYIQTADQMAREMTAAGASA
jgi:hypothetical protein